MLIVVGFQMITNVFEKLSGALPSFGI